MEHEFLKRAIQIESLAIASLLEQVDESYEAVLEILYNTKGKIVFTGVGKSGHIGTKLAATFASLGSPAIFVHSTEAVHGDFGMISSDDTIIYLTNSGETAEVLNLVPTLNVMNIRKIAITSKRGSSIDRAADASIIYTYEKEADHLGLAPTTSSTMTLVIGDALASALAHMKNFKKEDFHFYHPGGSLGAQLGK